ncbi:MAG: ribose-phosphate diphosphokinase [Gammaproteobacteria bacterium]|nr:ribose-phosphate diphosphokinase [Gammaproteobacteria bacterium]
MLILATQNCFHLARRLEKYKHARLLRYACKQFADGERYYRLDFQRQPKSLVLLANITPDPGSLFDLLALARAAQDSGIAIEALCIPYLAYSRQDRQSEKGEAVLARMVAEAINRIPARQRVFVDLHSDAVRAMLAPHRELSCLPWLVHTSMAQAFDLVVAPDAGAAERARSVAGNAPVLIMRKHRPRPNQVRRSATAYPVKGKRVLMVDDMVDTGRTIASAAVLLKKQGARSISVVATHAVFSAPSHKALASAPIWKIIVSDTLAGRAPHGVRVVSITQQLAEALNSERN